ncbi:hypothetical protein [Paludisphaera mucosa]|uniref:GNAT family N-acetyltransferase n=1 Tax=Paludisphaera mucosa TaxID=3030827 RepID=A0ABT6FLW8_9BACT|nr:hypothetical protein [Paludisphaera mucosa]MDG3008486.1 hypothetical protein [Paludisphaera mucosa]
MSLALMGRLYGKVGINQEGPTSWMCLQTMDGRWIGACLTFAIADRYVGRHPGRTFRAVCWQGGRATTRFLVRATSPKVINWVVERDA